MFYRFWPCHSLIETYWNLRILAAGCVNIVNRSRLGSAGNRNFMVKPLWKLSIWWSLVEPGQGNVMGTGKFSTVYLCFRRGQPNRRFALKVATFFWSWWKLVEWDAKWHHCHENCGTTWVAKMSLSLNPLSNGTVLALLRGWGVSLQRIEKLDMRHTFWLEWNF